MMLCRGVVLPIVLLLLTCTSSAGAAGSDPEPDRSIEGDRVCTRCHDETEARPVLSIYKTPHGVKADERTPGCQSCHGPSLDHVKNSSGSSTRPKVDVDFLTHTSEAARQQMQTCIGCHKGGQREHWAGSEHERRDVPCTACHLVHAAQDRVMNRITQQETCFGCHKTQRAQIHRISTHPLAVGEMACSDCHNPHGSIGPVLMAKNSINETCYTCHAERRGPFLWSHEPVQEDCTNCHTPHGSNNPSLLKARTPWLCQECHTADHSGPMNSGANLPGGSATTINNLQPLANQAPRSQLNARNCLSCHPMVHGSNHPAGARLSR